MHNPYQAPDANLDSPLPAAADGVAEPGRLLPRFGAHLIDTVIMLPVIAFTFWAAAMSRYFYVMWVVPSVLISLFYYVYLVQRFGGTPGKLLLKLRIQMLDGTPVTLKAALLRASVITAISLALSVGEALGALAMDDASYEGLDIFERSEALSAAAEAWGMVPEILMQVWIWGTLLFLLLNKRRRAPHDYMGGTAVVSTVRAG